MSHLLHIIGAHWRRVPWHSFLAVFSLLFLVRNFLLPMVGDDISYAFVWDGDHWGNLMDNIGPRERIDGFWDILVSQWSHYFTWGGRTFSMLWIQFFAWVGEEWFDIANTLVFMMLMLLLYWMSVGKIESPARHKGTLLWVLICMHFGVLDYVSTMLWMTGACVYLWTGFWECLFLLPFALAYRSGLKKSVPTSLMAFLGLQAGWSEEAGSLMTVGLTACALLAFYRQKRIERWMVVGSVFLLIGSGFLMLCPGSIHREQLMLELAPEYVLPVDQLWTWRMFRDNFFSGFLPIILWESFLFVPIILYFTRGRKSPLVRYDIVTALYILAFTVAGILVLCAMMFAPEFEPRTGFHSTLFLTVASSAAFKQIAPWMKQGFLSGNWRAKVAFAICAASVVYGFASMAGALCVESSIRRQYDQRLDFVQQHKADACIVVKAYEIPYGLDHYLGPRTITDMHLIYGLDLESKATDNRSLMFSQYYGLPPICIDRQVDWKKRQ